MKNRIIIAAAFTACLALCAAVWPQTEKVGETPTLSETAAVIAPQPTLPEAEKPVLPVVTEKKETEMPEDESALEVATEELPIPVPEIEDEAEAEQEYVPPTQTDSIPVQPTQPEPKSAPEPIANDNELADMVYVPGFGWIQSEGPNHVEYAEDMYENGNKIGTMGCPQKLRRINNEITAGEQKSIPAVILCQFIIQNLSSGKDIKNLKIGFSIDKLKLLC